MLAQLRVVFTLSMYVQIALFAWPHHFTVLQKHAYDDQNIKQTALIII